MTPSTNILCQCPKNMFPFWALFPVSATELGYAFIYKYTCITKFFQKKKRWWDSNSSWKKGKVPLDKIYYLQSNAHSNQMEWIKLTYARDFNSSPLYFIFMNTMRFQFHRFYKNWLIHSNIYLFTSGQARVGPAVWRCWDSVSALFPSSRQTG